MVRVLNDCYSAGKLCLSQRSGAITLLYKKRDVFDTANWRPLRYSVPITRSRPKHCVTVSSQSLRLLSHRISRAVTQAGSWGKTSVFCRMFAAMRLIMLSPQLYFPSTRGKHLTGSNDPFSRRSLYKWVLAPLLEGGSPSCILRSTLRSSLTVICPMLFPFRGGFDRGAHYPHCYTSLLPRLWPARSRQTLALIASLCHAAIAG